MGGLSNRPRIIPCAIYAPGKRITQLVIEGKNVPGVLAKIASKIAEHKVNILSGMMTAEPGKDTGILTLFLDLTDSKLKPEELVEELKALDVVLDAEVIAKKFGDIAIDGTTYTTLFLGKRIVMLDVDDVGAMFNWLDKTFGSGGHAILFDMGETAGRESAKKLRESYGLKGCDLIEAFLALHVAAGWFSYEVVECNEEELRFVIRLHGNFECTPFIGKRDRPMSHLIRGGLAGVFKEAYGRDFRVREVKCIAKGDEYCEFVVELADPRSNTRDR